MCTSNCSSVEHETDFELCLLDSAAHPTKKRGRPPIPKDPNAPSMPKPKRGRPRTRESPDPDNDEVKRRPGRPRKPRPTHGVRDANVSVALHSKLRKCIAKLLVHISPHPRQLLHLPNHALSSSPIVLALRDREQFLNGT